MEQINGHRVSLSHGIARGLAHGLISYGQSREVISRFAISATGTSKDKGVSLPLHRESPKPEMRNEKRPKAISAFRLPGVQETREPLFHCIGNPRNPKPEMRKSAQSHFGISATGSSRDKGVTLPLHRESRNPET
jgi:hypothetical protein